MSELNLSKVEIPIKSKSMSNHPPPEMDIITIKQIGDYILGEEIGSGAFGKVLLGKHILTEEKVAIKVLDKMILNQTPEDYELVKKEISILKLVRHKYIVQLYEILQTSQHIFIIMEYCEGKEILDYILTKNHLSELESLKYFQQLINCLFYLHSQNIAHRDIKIDNMLLDSNKDLKLIDFGLSTKYTDDDLLDQPCGTVVYAAPEVLEGKEYHGMLADVWSSGIVLYGMIAGYLPFSDKDDEVNKKLVIKGQIKMPDFFSDQVKDLLKHMLDVNPMTRYTLQEIKDHPWFNIEESSLIPGIIINYNIIPIDEKIINLCVSYNKDRDDVINSIRKNKHDSNSALYYLLIKKLLKNGEQSISDMYSDEFIDFVLDENNLINKENVDIKEDKSEMSFENINTKKGEILIVENSNDINLESINIKEEDEKENIIIEEIKNENKTIKNDNIKLSNIVECDSPKRSIKKDIKKIESDIKNTNSPLIKKNYDIDETYTNKDFSEKIELKNSEKLDIKEDKIEIEKFNEINEQEDDIFKPIILDDQKRISTEANANNKIIEKIMNNLEEDINKIKMLEIDINNKSNENNNLKKDEKHEMIIYLNNSKENDSSVAKKDNSKIDLERNKNNENINDNIKEKKQKKNLKKENIGKVINNSENLDNQKQKQIKTKENERNKIAENNKQKIKFNNKYLSNTTKKKLYFNEKSNNVLKQLKKNLTKEQNFGVISPMSEMKTEKKQNDFRKKNKNKIFSADKGQYNFSSRNSKNKYVLINNRVKSNQKPLLKNNNFSNVKRKTSNKIFNIINIINNNFNSNESDIRMRNYFSTSHKNKENLNIENLKKKFDEISFQQIKGSNYNNIILSPIKIISHSNKENERNTSIRNNHVNTKTNNITIIIQNKKGDNKNNMNGNILKSIINFDNKNIINLSGSHSKKKNKEINNNLDFRNKKDIRKKNLESSVQEKRYQSPLGVRELSESPKQKYLNKKTRLNRIPWKIKKKGIDNKLDSKQIYNKYKSIIQNPFNQNNSKIVNVNKSIKNSICNSIRSSLCDSRKTNKSSFAKNFKEIIYNNKFPKNIKQIKKNNRAQHVDYYKRKKEKNLKEIVNNENSKLKDKKILNSNSKSININPLFSLSNIFTNINNTEKKNSILNIKKSLEKFNFKSIDNALSINLNKKFNKSETEFNNIYVPMNLCCFFFKKNDISTYKNYIKSKLKKKSISYTVKKNNSFICNKNGYNCDLQICKLNINNNNLYVELKDEDNKYLEKEPNNLYYLKMYGKRESFGINNFFKKFVFNLD